MFFLVSWRITSFFSSRRCRISWSVGFLRPVSGFSVDRLPFFFLPRFLGGDAGSSSGRPPPDPEDRTGLRQCGIVGRYPEIIPYAAEEMAKMSNAARKLKLGEYHESVAAISIVSKTRRKRWVRELREKHERAGKRTARYRLTGRHF